MGWSRVVFVPIYGWSVFRFVSFARYICALLLSPLLRRVRLLFFLWCFGFLFFCGNTLPFDAVTSTSGADSGLFFVFFVLWLVMLAIWSLRESEHRAVLPLSIARPRGGLVRGVYGSFNARSGSLGGGLVLPVCFGVLFSSHQRDRAYRVSQGRSEHPGIRSAG